MRTFWLSFVDPELPAGRRFLGVAIVDVSDEEARAAAEVVRQQFPHARDGAEWIAAATRKSWARGCNPGGEVACAELPLERATGLPRDRLLTRTQLKRFGCDVGE